MPDYRDSKVLLAGQRVADKGRVIWHGTRSTLNCSGTQTQALTLFLSPAPPPPLSHDALTQSTMSRITFSCSDHPNRLRKKRGAGRILQW
eukprot:8047395-Pyramimonas_sp.AAC.1